MNTLESYRRVVRNVQPLGLTGRVHGVRGLTVTVGDFPAPVGASCRIVRSQRGIDARVVGFTGRHTLVMPLGSPAGICKGDRVIFTSAQQSLAVGRAMLGRMIDGAGRPIDGKGQIACEVRAPLWPAPIGPMQRRGITDPLATGIRAIDALMTVGMGQRMGIFSGSGVGKSVMLGMISRYTSADVTVIALIGERGREVRDFVERQLGQDGLEKSVIVVSTSEDPPLLRVQAAAVAAAVAEYFRDRGMNVLLLMDSLSRLATAQRTVGLAAGEPPTTRGYPPSVFNLLPELLERSGRTERGSITGFYTVLVEGDDFSEPVADAVRSVTDGHICLSRTLANQGHYPAIDVLASISRVMIDVVSKPQLNNAREVQKLMAAYAEIQDLVSVGAYRSGANSQGDLAIAAMDEINKFLVQEIDEYSTLDNTLGRLDELHRRIERIRHDLQRQ